MRVAGPPPPVSPIAPPARAFAQAGEMQPFTELPQGPPKIGTQAMPGDSSGASSDISGVSIHSPGASTDPVGASPPPSNLYTTVVPSYQRMRDTAHPPSTVSAISKPQSKPFARTFSASPAPTRPRSSTSSSHTWSIRSTISNFRNRQSTAFGHAAADREIVSIKFKLYSTAGRVGLDALCRFRHDHERHMPEPYDRATLDSNPPCVSCARMLKMYHCNAGMVYRDFSKFCEDHEISLHAVQCRQYSKTICLQLSCQALKKMDVFSASDAYAHITYRTSDAGPWKYAARSKVQKKEANPVFEELRFSIFGSSGEELDEAQICIEILDHDRFSRNDPIGRFLTTPTALAQLKKRDKIQLEGYVTGNQRSSGPFVGFIWVDDFKDHPATPLS